MKKKTTIADVAKHAAVSKSTVSQFLNGRYSYMKEETKNRIADTINELGYQGNFVARSLRLKRTSTIGVIVANILHSSSSIVIQAIEDVCSSENMHVIVCNADEDPDKERKYINMLQAKQVDGLIVFPTGKNIELYKTMVEQDFPIVFMDRLIHGVSIDAFLLDNELASKLAIDCFIEGGHHRIGMITPPLDRKITPRIERVEGYKNALKYHNIDAKKEYVEITEINEVKNGLDRMLFTDYPPTALYIVNDLMLMEVLSFAKEKSINIPKDLAVINVDDVPFADIYSPTLTTIFKPEFEMARDAARLLLKKINGEDPKKGGNVYRYKPKLIVRGSS